MGPAAKFRGEKKKGLTVTVWAADRGGYTVSIEKSWKRKDSDTYETRKLSIFDSELSEMTGLMLKACDWLRANSEPDTRSERHLEEKANAYAPQEIAPSDFTDDDIPF